MLKLIHHWWLPVLSAIIWWGMLIALLACWAGQGKPVYAWMHAPPGQTILYISDVAASNLQPIFIACAGAQGLLFVLALASERYLRHAGRLRRNHRKREKVLSGFAIGWAIIGQLGILFVSIFNTKIFPHAHSSMLAVFIVFVGISSLFSIAEYYYLDKGYSDYRAVAFSVRAKAVWFIIELALAIAFVSSKKHHKNASAVLEWTISFVYPFYALLLAYDLWPAHNKKKGHYGHNNFQDYKGDETHSDGTVPYPQDPEAAAAFGGAGYGAGYEQGPGFQHGNYKQGPAYNEATHPGAQQGVQQGDHVQGPAYNQATHPGAQPGVQQGYAQQATAPAVPQGHDTAPLTQGGAPAQPSYQGFNEGPVGHQAAVYPDGAAQQH